MKKLLIILAAAMAVAACNKAEMPSQPAEPATLHATIEDVDATKTSMDADKNILWSSGDQVAAFIQSSNRQKYQIESSSAGQTTAVFKQVSGTLSSNGNLDHNVVYYPYSDVVEVEKSGSDYSLNVVLPTEQNYVKESFDNGAMAMVAVSENNNISFRNVLGGMKLQLKGTQRITTIRILGGNSEKLSGPATVTAYADNSEPKITMSPDALTSVTYICGKYGTQLKESAATTFIISLPPVEFTKGFTVLVTDTNKKTYVISTSKVNTVYRSSLLAMPALSLSDFDARKGDYVDEYGINHGQGISVGGYVWAPVNCGYHKDDYKYGKLYQWGRRFGFGYDNSDASIPVIETGGDITPEMGNDYSNYNMFYTGTAATPNDWANPHDGMLWNVGSEDSPVKSSYDPCPAGWRIPNDAELKALTILPNNSTSQWTVGPEGLNGYWFIDGASDNPDAARIFLPATGYLDYAEGEPRNRGNFGYYWSSDPFNINYGSVLCVRNGTPIISTVFRRANAVAIRCVSE